MFSSSASSFSWSFVLSGTVGRFFPAGITAQKYGGIHFNQKSIPPHCFYCHQYDEIRQWFLFKVSCSLPQIRSCTGFRITGTLPLTGRAGCTFKPDITLGRLFTFQGAQEFLTPSHIERKTALLQRRISNFFIFCFFQTLFHSRYSSFDHIRNALLSDAHFRTNVFLLHVFQIIQRNSFFCFSVRTLIRSRNISLSTSRSKTSCSWSFNSFHSSENGLYEHTLWLESIFSWFLSIRSEASIRRRTYQFSLSKNSDRNIFCCPVTDW